MPRQRIPEGCGIGALSYVPPEFEFESWAVYAGIPARKVGERDRTAVLAQATAMNRWMDATPDP
jgi:carbonic anhydrase/acetyltransferase-like protein (isoleucine patch superfamily)